MAPSRQNITSDAPILDSVQLIREHIVGTAVQSLSNATNVTVSCSIRFKPCLSSGLYACSSQSMAVHGSGHSMMVHNSGPSMSVAQAGGGPGLVGPLQDKLNRLLLNANSPAKSSSPGSLIAAGRYDNLSASLSQSVKVGHFQHTGTTR